MRVEAWRKWIVEFPERLAHLRKLKGLSQSELSQAIGIHLSQIKRYEKGSSQPTLDVLRNMAKVLEVSADLLLFGTDERGPQEELRLQFDAIRQLDAEEQKAVKLLLDGVILRHQAKQWINVG